MRSQMPGLPKTHLPDWSRRSAKVELIDCTLADQPPEEIFPPVLSALRRRNAEHELEVFGARVVPGKAAFRLEKHWVD
jgi:hypothetical protein